MRIDIGTPEPWVKVTPFGPSANGQNVCAGFAVRCDRCGATSSIYRPYLDKHPGWIAWAVETHNRCLPRAA